MSTCVPLNTAHIPSPLGTREPSNRFNARLLPTKSFLSASWKHPHARVTVIIASQVSLQLYAIVGGVVACVPFGLGLERCFEKYPALMRENLSPVIIYPYLFVVGGVAAGMFSFLCSHWLFPREIPLSCGWRSALLVGSLLSLLPVIFIDVGVLIIPAFLFGWIEIGIVLFGGIFGAGIWIAVITAVDDQKGDYYTKESW